MIGQSISHYRILEKLGEGGMGAVYKAEDLKLKRTVALKFIPPEHRDRFLREGQAAAALNHPNICTIHEIDEAHGFLAMEFLEGISLREKIADRPLKLDDAFRIALQVCDGLQAAHDRGVIHRDIKPANVMVTPEGHVKITDFGLAHMGERSRITKTGSSMGTPAYMSPEQASGGSADRRSDIWSVAVVLYEMLTGRLPFAGQEDVAIAFAIVHATPEPLTALRTGLPVELDRVMSRALAKDPGERYQHVEEFASELKRLARQAAPAPSNRISRALQIAWGVAGLSLAAVTVLAALLIRRPDAPEPIIRFQIPSSIGGVIGSDIPAVSPDGTSIVYGEKGKLWIRRLDMDSSLPLPGTEGASFPFWSPDGAWLAFFAGPQIMRISVKGGTAEKIVDAQFGLGGTWAPDGKILFSPENRGTLRLWYPGQSAVEITTRDRAFAENSHRLPWFLPGGQRFLFLGRSSKKEMTAIYWGKIGDKQAKRLLAVQSNAAYAPEPSGGPGWLVYTKAGNLVAQRFDPDRGELSGEPQLVAESVYWVPPSSLTAFSVSANGRVLAYRSSGFPVSQFHWFDRSGKRLSTVGPRGQFSNLRLSPDRKRLAVTQPDPRTGNRDVWILDMEKDLLSRLTLSDANEMWPRWSSDGKWINYGMDATGELDVYRKLASGVGNAEPLGVPGSHATWTPDGRWIVAQDKDGDDILLIPSDRKGQAIPLANSEFIETTPELSPDGKWLAYVSNESGRMEVYVRSLPEIAPVQPGRWQISRNGAGAPIWRQDGKELFFIDTENQIVAVSVGGQSEFVAGTPRALFKSCAYSFGQSPAVSASYDVAADGQSFLINCLAEETAHSPISVVVNWTRKLRK